MSTRAFLGIGLASHVRATLGLAGASVRKEARTWRDEKWVPEENLHVTLKFLGTIEESAIDEIVAAVEAAAGEHAEYLLAMGELQAIPKLRAASMIWAEPTEGQRATAALAGSIDRRLAQLGFEAPARPFSAHITLARARRPKTITFDALDAGNRVLYAAADREKRMSVRGITLYSSTLTPRGALYEELAIVPLTGD
ncbi:MAG: RNA 2',3'-cyclic phosphodiesterase [Actinobacteria bacterium]|nr:MAG: RNA 2',3'-cyclic phosphodiesterase [Actinomycetota bacterium]